MTYSIVGFDPNSGDLGVAAQSKFPNVGGLVPYATAKVGAIATQAFGSPAHGAQGLELLSAGMSPQQVLSSLLDNDANRAQRQIGIISACGDMAGYTGNECLEWTGWAGSVYGTHCICQGNGLASENVLTAMINAFDSTAGALADKLIQALLAAENAGGELRGQQSASLLVVRENGGYGGVGDRYVDIRIYDHQTPIEELARCYEIHKLSYFSSDPENLVKITGDIANELVKIMTDRGFYPYSYCNHWGENEIKSLERFMGWENYDNRLRNDDLIDLEVLHDMREKHRILGYKN